MKRRNILKAGAAVLAGLSAQTAAVASSECTPSKDVKLLSVLEIIHLMRLNLAIRCVDVDGYFAFTRGIKYAPEPEFPNGRIELGMLTHFSEDGVMRNNVSQDLMEKFKITSGNIFYLANLNETQTKAYLGVPDMEVTDLDKLGLEWK